MKRFIPCLLVFAACAHVPMPPEQDHPVPDGPCAQETVSPVKWPGRMLWIGDSLVADSDFQRTLLASPASRRPMRRALLLRGVGYAVIGLGLGATIGTVAALSQTRGLDDAPYGFSLLGISAAGVGLVAAGKNEQARAVNQFNAAAEVTGECDPVW